MCHADAAFRVGIQVRLPDELVTLAVGAAERWLH